MLIQKMVAVSAECFGGEPEVPVNGIFFPEFRLGKSRRLMENLGRIRLSVQYKEGWEKQLQVISKAGTIFPIIDLTR
jgi:hypothetical protein